MNRTLILVSIAIFGMSACAGLQPAADRSTAAAPVSSYIVQARSLAAAQAAVHSADGSITHELGVIGAVAAELTAAQLAELRKHSAVRRVYANEA